MSAHATDHRVPQPASFSDFPTAFQGTLLRPGDEGFQASRRIFNMLHAGATPALIAKPDDEASVAAVLQYVSAHDIPIAIRGGGHLIDGLAMPHGALVLDMSGFKTIEVDPQTRRIRAGAGVLLGEFDAAAQAHGLVVPSGTVSSTGIAGLTLGGGVGNLMRRFGATVDNLITCRLVSLGGEIITASATENPELFWALRGGGGNFGVVTMFEYQAHRLDHDVTAGLMGFPIEQAPEILLNLAAWMPAAPRELALISIMIACPPLPGVSPDRIGRPVLVLLVAHSGHPDTAGPVLDYLQHLGTPFMNAVRPMPWVKANSILDAVAPYGRKCYNQGGYLASLPRSVIASLAGAIVKAPQSPGSIAALNLYFFGGAISEDFPETSTAFSREGAALLWEGITQWDDPALNGAFPAWLNEVAAALPLLSNGYSNLTTDQGEAWRRGLWGSPGKLNRLRAVKAQWDPRNLLRYNKNIPQT
jgi:hypothetical protein